MSIYVGSRYADGTLSYLALTQDGDQLPVLTKYPLIPSVGSYIDYIIVYGDRLDSLGDKFFGDPLLWWKIAQINPTLDELTPLVPGITIRVPSA